MFCKMFSLEENLFVILSKKAGNIRWFLSVSSNGLRFVFQDTNMKNNFILVYCFFVFV